eukprot:scaffold104115_cov67-Phaeocystis_antarctica.AAC.4
MGHIAAIRASAATPCGSATCTLSFLAVFQTSQCIVLPQTVAASTPRCSAHAGTPLAQSVGMSVVGVVAKTSSGISTHGGSCGGSGGEGGMGGGEGAQPAEIRGGVYTPLIVGNSRWSRSAVSCEGLRAALKKKRSCIMPSKRRSASGL